MATIVNARDVLLQATSPRINSYPIGNGTIDFGNVTGPTRPSNNADVTSTAVNSGVTVTNTSGGIVINGGGSIKGGQTAYDSGTGFFLGYSGAAYKFSIGNGTKKLTWDGSTLGIVGDITGSSSLDITGTAKFGGATLDSGQYWTAIFNQGGTNAVGGVLTYGNNGLPAVRAIMLSTSTTSPVVDAISYSPNGFGVLGTNASTGIGVEGYSIAGIGVEAYSSTGYALRINGNGVMRWGGYTCAAPTGDTTKFLRNDGTWVAPLSFTPVQQGGGTGQGTNKVYIGWLSTKLGLQVDSTNFSDTWPINVTGNAATLGTYAESQFARKGGGTFTLTVPGVGTYPDCYIT